MSIDRGAEPRPSELCLNCGGYVDAMNADAIGRFRKDGSEMTWCSQECLTAWAEKRRRDRAYKAAFDV